ncbi:hypothetical protein EJ06DRAFT_530074 [Trichodelitschia bisporula]|uniref:Pentacotripeptide-repeat region of PRORP domain-containing protein n=1 Tax=Trichodelitschia bisporula TaxID=703511 RepID=A0A6G1HYA5_9PEZI|nr:hypothetical protein EJ06DRAFT_530074 [Trichodelitschia bisporula]
MLLTAIPRLSSGRLAILRRYALYCSVGTAATVTAFILEGQRRQICQLRKIVENGERLKALVRNSHSDASVASPTRDFASYVASLEARGLVVREPVGENEDAYHYRLADGAKKTTRTSDARTAQGIKSNDPFWRHDYARPTSRVPMRRIPAKGQELLKGVFGSDRDSIPRPIAGNGSATASAENGGSKREESSLRKQQDLIELNAIKKSQQNLQIQQRSGSEAGDAKVWSPFEPSQPEASTSTPTPHDLTPTAEWTSSVTFKDRGSVLSMLGHLQSQNASPEELNEALQEAKLFRPQELCDSLLKIDLQSFSSAWLGPLLSALLQNEEAFAMVLDRVVAHALENGLYDQLIDAHRSLASTVASEQLASRLAEAYVFTASELADREHFRTVLLGVNELQHPELLVSVFRRYASQISLMADLRGHCWSAVINIWNTATALRTIQEMQSLLNCPDVELTNVYAELIKAVWVRTLNFRLVRQLYFEVSHIKQRTNKEVPAPIVNAMLWVCFKKGAPEEAEDIVAKLRNDGVAPNASWFPFLLAAYAKCGDDEGFERTFKALDACLSRGKSKAPLKMGNVVQAYAWNHSPEEVVQLIDRCMGHYGMVPQAGEFDHALLACIHDGNATRRLVDNFESRGFKACVSRQTMTTVVGNYIERWKPKPAHILHLLSYIHNNQPELLTQELVTKAIRYCKQCSRSIHQMSYKSEISVAAQQTISTVINGLEWLLSQAIPLKNPQFLEHPLPRRTYLLQLMKTRRNGLAGTLSYVTEMGYSRRDPETVLLIYAELTSKPLPLSVTALNLALQACFELGDSERASAILDAAIKDGHDPTAAQRIFLTETISHRQVPQYQLCDVVLDHYAAMEAAHIPVHHGLATAAAASLLQGYGPVMRANPGAAADILLAVLQSPYALTAPPNIDFFTVLLRAYVKARAVSGVRWVIREVVRRGVQIDNRFKYALDEGMMGIRQELKKQGNRAEAREVWHEFKELNTVLTRTFMKQKNEVHYMGLKIVARACWLANGENMKTSWRRLKLRRKEGTRSGRMMPERLNS